jgi:hypothetical protein
MSKPGTPVNAPAGLAEWLPLLGSICQILASFGEEREDDTPRAETVPGSAPGNAPGSLVDGVAPGEERR